MRVCSIASSMPVYSTCKSNGVAHTPHLCWATALFSLSSRRLATSVQLSLGGGKLTCSMVKPADTLAKYVASNMSPPPSSSPAARPPRNAFPAPNPSSMRTSFPRIARIQTCHIYNGRAVSETRRNPVPLIFRTIHICSQFGRPDDDRPGVDRVTTDIEEALCYFFDELSCRR